MKRLAPRPLAAALENVRRDASPATLDVCHLANRRLSTRVIFDRYETFMYQQWMRVYMRSQMIKHNKDLLQLVDDTDGLLAKLHVF